jgi:hypothetical protein
MPRKKIKAQLPGNFVERIRGLTDTRKFKDAAAFIAEASALCADEAVPEKAREYLRQAAHPSPPNAMELVDGRNRRYIVQAMRENLTLLDFFPEGEWTWLPSVKEITRNCDSRYFTIFAERKQQGEATLYAAASNKLTMGVTPNGSNVSSWLKQQPFENLTTYTDCYYDEFDEEDFTQIDSSAGTDRFGNLRPHRPQANDVMSDAASDEEDYDPTDGGMRRVFTNPNSVVPAPPPEDVAVSTTDAQLLDCKALHQFLEGDEGPVIGRKILRIYLSKLVDADKETREHESCHIKAFFCSLEDEIKRILAAKTERDENAKEDCAKEKAGYEQQLLVLPAEHTRERLDDLEEQLKKLRGKRERMQELSEFAEVMNALHEILNKCTAETEEKKREHAICHKTLEERRTLEQKVGESSDRLSKLFDVCKDNDDHRKKSEAVRNDFDRFIETLVGTSAATSAAAFPSSAVAAESPGAPEMQLQHSMNQSSTASARSYGCCCQPANKRQRANGGS